MTHGFAFVPLGARARGAHAVRARAAGREASADPPVDRHPHPGALHQQPALQPAAAAAAQAAASAAATVAAAPRYHRRGRRAVGPARHQPSPPPPRGEHQHQQQLQGTPRRPRVGTLVAVSTLTQSSEAAQGITSSSSSALWLHPNPADNLSSSEDIADSTGSTPSHSPSRFGAQSLHLASSQSSSSSSGTAPVSVPSLPHPLSPALTDADAAWLDAAARADILAMAAHVRRGFDNIGAYLPDTKTTALHLAAAQAREDCVCAIFELARGVGETFAHRTGHRDDYARTVCDQVDDRGRNSLHYAATVSDFRAPLDQIDRTVRRLVAYGVSPWAMDYDHVTPLALARELGNSKAATTLAALARAAGA